MNAPIVFPIVVAGAVYIEAAFIAAGWLGIFIEFVRPGRVVPGVAGGVLLLVGLSKLLPDHPGIAIAASIPFLLAGFWMLAMARKARRNKRAL